VTPVVSNLEIQRALSTYGYRFSEPGAPETKTPLSDFPALSPDDTKTEFSLVICATPSPMLETALRAVSSHLATDSIVVTCQNGLPEQRAVKLVGDRVVGCVVGWGASMTEPGVYRRTSSGRLQIGKATPDCPLPDSLLSLLRSISPIEVVDDLPSVRWSKLAINCVTSPFGAIGGAPLGVLLKYAAVRRLALELFAEVAQVAHLEGIKMRPVAGTLDISSIAMNAREKNSRFALSLLVKHALLLAVGFKFRRMRSSMLYALERGRPIEIEYLNGEVAQRGKRLGFATPINDGIVKAVRDIQKKKLASSPAALCMLSAQLG
jgi:2-dehydropantoate 2-reductase